MRGLGLLGVLAAIAVGGGGVAWQQAIALPAAAPAITGPVERVVDGDTIIMAGTKVRIWGIDAPESHQACQDLAGNGYPCGQIASQRLYQLINGQPLACAVRGNDMYGRLLATCRLSQGQDVGSEMVGAGWAIANVQFGGWIYLPSEISARLTKAGIWAGTFQVPAEWRHMHEVRN